MDISLAPRFSMDSTAFFRSTINACSSSRFFRAVTVTSPSCLSSVIISTDTVASPLAGTCTVSRCGKNDT